MLKTKDDSFLQIMLYGFGVYFGVIFGGFGFGLLFWKFSLFLAS